MQIAAASTVELPISVGRYYLPPAWRVGNRMSYVVNQADHRPLWPVRFLPRWDYWDDMLNVLGPTRITGIPRRLLERALVLASQAVSEDNETRPKVGALIVRDGVVLAEAYRNEDGQGSHAEQIAFRKTGKRDLTGATVITTLEPCTTGRSNHTAACAELIAMKGIKQVVIGTLDPDPRIRGTAEFALRQNAIVVEHFPDELAKRIHDIDRKHIDRYLKDRFRSVVVYRSLVQVATEPSTEK
jgi:pyrimidine deaminase RibD-like protein